MKPKEWLKSNGHISEIGRGRMSREHIALIEQAVRDGANIEGYAVSKAEPKTEAEKSTPAVEKVRTDPNRIMDVPDERRSENVWKAHAYLNGEKVNVGMRTVCNTCHNSLTYCPCRTPIVNVAHNATGVVNFTLK